MSLSRTRPTIHTATTIRYHVCEDFEGPGVPREYVSAHCVALEAQEALKLGAIPHV
jgi:hypothetical protein